MGKQRTVHGAYSSDDMGKDKVSEMDKERTRPKTVADGRSLADELDWTPKRENLYPHDGLAASIKRKR
jgi:hypothetical protein